MELTGEVAIHAPRQQVWQALNDAAVLKACIPGCEEVVDESPTLRRARVMIKMGPVRARFSGLVQIADVQAPQGCTMSFEGSGGAAGMASGQSRVELVETAASETLVRYTVKASVGGKLGQIGGRMIDASAKALADQFFGALQTHLAPPAPESAIVPEGDGSGPHAADGAAAASAASAAGASAVVTDARGSTAIASPSSHPCGADLRSFLWGAVSMAVGVFIGATFFR